MTLSFGVMLGFLQRAMPTASFANAQTKDPRLASNATRYSIKDTVLAAFSVFFMQCESFLEHQRQMHSRCGQDNAQSLFGLMRIPTTPQIRNILDALAQALERDLPLSLHQSDSLERHPTRLGSQLVPTNAHPSVRW